MEIFVNELSLDGQFNSVEHFVNTGLMPFIRVFNEIDRKSNLLYKKYDFYKSKITSRLTYGDIWEKHMDNPYKHEEIRKFYKLLEKLVPYCEDDFKHSANCVYLFNGNNICGSSLAEAYERDEIVISFIHSSFSNFKLQISKNNNIKIIYNLFQIEHYIEVAFNCGQISKCE